MIATSLPHIAHSEAILHHSSFASGKGIRDLLGEYMEEISLVGEADSFAQTIHMAQQLRPQVVVMDVHMTDVHAPDIKTQLESYGSCLVAISFSIDQETAELAKGFGAVKLIDKMNLSDRPDSGNTGMHQAEGNGRLTRI